MTKLELKPISQDYSVEKTQAAVDQYSAMVDTFRELRTSRLGKIYLVGAGGSWVSLQAATWRLQQELTTPVFLVQSDEFNSAPPLALDGNTTTIVCSSSGTLKETVAAIDTAKQRGSYVIAVTGNAGSPLAAGADKFFVGDPDTVAMLTAWALIEAMSPTADREAATAEALAALPSALLTVQEEQEGFVRDLATKIADEPMVFVLASGPYFGWAYGTAMCWMQESHWKQAISYNSGEFFQGAFEMLRRDTATIVFLGEDPTRRMGERALRFVETYSDKTYVIDRAQLSLPGIPASRRVDVAAIANFFLLFRLGRHLEDLRDHDIDERHYMFKVDY